MQSIFRFDLWKTEWQNRRFKLQFFSSLGLLAVVLTGFFFVLGYAENREGIVIEKNWIGIPAKDFSTLIFSLTYFVAVAGIVYCFGEPKTALLLIRAYLLLQFLRGIALILVPLAPPEHIIPLNDPFLRHTFYNGRPNLKDLFFSGHVATSFLFFCLVKNKFLKYLFLACTLAIALLMIVQRVHYVTDIVVAPSAAFFCFRLAEKWTM